MQLSKDISLLSWDYWRVVSALAVKDIVDALRNKTTLTIVIGMGMMILTVQALPFLLKMDRRPRVAIYDADRSGLADELRREGELQILEMRSAEEARNTAPEASAPLLAITMPDDWENTAGVLQVAGFLAHWISPGDAEQLIGEAEETLSAAIGRPVDVEAHTVYPTLENGGHNIMVALGLVLATILITTILVPNLILEEKVNHTLEVLRISPASINQVLFGKGLAGALYGLLAAAMLLVFNLARVNHWGIMLAATLLTIFLGVGLGLLVGSLVENEGSVQMWVGLLAVALLFPVVFAFVSSSRLPSWLQLLIDWMPTTAASDLMRISFGNTFPADLVWSRLGVLLLSVILVFGAAGWRLRRWEA